MFSSGFWFTVYAIIVAAAETRGGEAERCFLYTVKNNEISPKYSLQENPDIYLTLQHIYRRNTFTQVMDEKGTCIVGLNYKNRTQTQNGCQVNFASGDEYTTLVFQQLGHEFTVYQRDSIREEVILTTRPQSLCVKTNMTVNVLFDCLGTCYQFEKAVIHKYYPDGTVTHDPLIIYGRVKDTRMPYNPNIGTRTRNQPWPLLSTEGFFLPTKKTKKGDWFSYEFKPSFTKCAGNDTCQDNHNYLMEIAVTDLSTNASFRFNGDPAYEVNSADLFLGFARSSNIRWALCKPWSPMPIKLQRPPGHSSVFSKEKGFVPLMVVCAVLCIACFGEGIYIYRQRQQLKTAPLPPTPNTHPNAAATTKSNMNETLVNEEALDDHEYEYIDAEALQRQLETQRSASRINFPMDEASREKEEQTSKKRISHTSVNSIYGCVVKRD